MTLTADIDGRKAPVAFAVTGAMPFFGLIAAHGALSVVLAFATGYRFDPGMAGILSMILVFLVPWFLLLLLIRRVVLLAVVDKSERPIADLWSVLKALAADRPRLFGGALRLAAAAFLIGSFAYQKELVAVLQPFGWDQAFADLDRFLHLGHDPYALVLAAAGTPWAITTLNAAYHAWFFVIYFVVFVACFAPPHHRASSAFLIALVPTFAIGGNLVAMAFSSAGPVYFERLGLGDDFVPLMTHLAQAAETSPVWALDVQEGLWDGYAGDGALAGISAMPSMHVATTVLLALYAASYARWAGILLWIFAALIMVGSVALGWHYAVDGYAGALIAWAAWRAGFWLNDRFSPA